MRTIRGLFTCALVLIAVNATSAQADPKQPGQKERLGATKGNLQTLESRRISAQEKQRMAAREKEYELQCQPRVWTDRKGNQIAEAMYLRSTKENVTLLYADGNTRDLVLKQLSGNDQGYVRRLRKLEAKVQSDRKRLGKPPLHAPPGSLQPRELFDCAEPPVGKRGGLRRVKIIQILDKRSALVAEQYFVPGGPRGTQIWGQRPSGGYSEPRIKQGRTILLRGVSMEGLVDDVEHYFEGIFEITGTHTYKTTEGGTRTVFVVEPCRAKEKQAKKDNQQPAQPLPPPAPQQPLR